MKIKVFIFLLLSVPVILSAQEKFKFGVKGGLNLATHELMGISDKELKKEYREIYEYRTAFHVGVVGYYKINEKLSLRPELLYAVKGLKYIKLDYINLPISLDYDIIPKISLTVGTELGYLLSAKNDNNLKVSYYRNNFDLGVFGGLKYSITDNFFIETRYIYGLTNLHDIQITDESGNPTAAKVKNRTIQFSVGYYIR